MASTNDYDVITVGGGLAGSSLAGALAKAGLRVLVLERETKFKDRVRGEQMHPWGVAELEALGLYELLQGTCGHALPWFDIYINDQPAAHRNLVDTTPQRAPEFSFFHPDMQEVLLQAATDAGAHVRRGARPADVEGGSRPKVSVLEGEETREYSARLVVGADGRNSSMRERGGFVTRHDDGHTYRIAGLLMDEVSCEEDTSLFLLNPDRGSAFAMFPQGEGRVRTYLPMENAPNFAGEDGLKLYAELAERPGMPPKMFEQGRAVGPIATFDTTNTWVDHPFRNGIALVGDAAASNDPCFGEGLSLTLRDVRVLRDHLLASDDWHTAANAYATDHDGYWRNLFEATNMYHRILYENTSDARELRAQALPRIAEDPTRIPDDLFTGPDEPISDANRDRFFGAD